MESYGFLRSRTSNSTTSPPAHLTPTPNRSTKISPLVQLPSSKATPSSSLASCGAQQIPALHAPRQIHHHARSCPRPFRRSSRFTPSLRSPQPFRPRLPHRISQNTSGSAIWNGEFLHRRSRQAKTFGLAFRQGSNSWRGIKGEYVMLKNYILCVARFVHSNRKRSVSRVATAILTSILFAFASLGTVSTGAINKEKKTQSTSKPAHKTRASGLGTAPRLHPMLRALLFLHTHQ